MNDHTISESDRKDPLPEPTARAPWNPPRLRFVEPQLTRQGDLHQLTGQGFFGTFLPDPEDGGS